MNIGLLAHNSKKSLMEDFCLAYKKFLPGSIGGEKQFVEMIARNEMDMVIFFYNPLLNSPKEPSIDAICRACDNYNIPIATNIATAESLILGLANGDLEWREQV